MPDPVPADVPTAHRWQSAEYVEEWAATANDAPHRGAVFDAFVAQLSGFVGSGSDRGLALLELGSGPGYLAEQLCSRVAVARYVAVDVSPHMHAIAAARLAPWADVVEQREADYRAPGWERAISGRFDAVVTLQAVHELRRADLIPGLYAAAYGLLRDGGAFLMADLVNVPGEEPRGHMLTVAEHVDTLTGAGFAPVQTVVDLGRIALLRAERSG